MHKLKLLSSDTALSVHQGRAGNNAIDKDVGVAVARALLAKEAAGEVVITELDPPAPHGMSNAQALNAATDKIDQGEFVILEIVTTQWAKKGDHGREGVRVTYHLQSEPESRKRHLNVKWRLPD